MSDEILSPQPDPATQTSRLDRIEARLAILEDRIAGAGAALPPPRDPDPVPPGAAATGIGAAPIMGQLNDFVRNNPVLALIGVIILLVVLSHLFD